MLVSITCLAAAEFFLFKSNPQTGRENSLDPAERAADSMALHARMLWHVTTYNNLISISSVSGQWKRMLTLNFVCLFFFFFFFFFF